MRLDDRNVRFVTPLDFGFGRKKLVRLGRRRGSLHLQETALVAEGELLRFHYFGIEMFFRRALSEWTTVTIPYSRIEVIRPSRWWLWVLAALAAAWVVLLALTVESVGEWVGGSICGLIWLLPVLFLVWRKRTRQTVAFRGKDGTLRVLTFKVRPKPVRIAFIAALDEQRQAALGHSVVRPEGVG